MAPSGNPCESSASSRSASASSTSCASAAVCERVVVVSMPLRRWYVVSRATLSARESTADSPGNVSFATAGAVAHDCTSNDRWYRACRNAANACSGTPSARISSSERRNFDENDEGVAMFSSCRLPVTSTCW
eukprot:Amastigsp_a188018_7.p4 type:complete len:132 gc:universal Amastigsp_a188018_7:422-27(-)